MSKGYSAPALKGLALAALREQKRSGRFKWWEVHVDDHGARLVIMYEPRHWTHCPGCAGHGEANHVDPSGNSIAEGIAHFTVRLGQSTKDEEVKS